MSFISLDYFDYKKVLSSNQDDKTVINTQARNSLQSETLFNRIKKFFALRKENKLFFEKIFNIFQSHFNIENKALFQKIWDKSLATKKINLKEGDTLTLELFKKIDNAISDALVYSGRGIKNNGESKSTDAQKIIGFLLSENNFPKDAINFDVLKAVLSSKDEVMLQGFRLELQNALKSSINENNLPKTPEEEILLKTYIGNILSLLPFAYPDKGFEIQIPQKNNEHWAMVNYVVDKKINLTPEWFSSPIPAFGLLPKEATLNAPPLLLCLGTTYPAGDGYVATLLADFTPGMSVGHAPYLLGKEAIQSWLSDKNGVHVYGMSLGGATAFQVVRHHADKIAVAEVFNPPGLYAWNWDKEFNDDRSQINIYTQKNDLVSSMGSFPTGDNVSLYEIFGGKEGEGENPVLAHCRAHSAMDDVTILKLDSKLENRSIARIALTFIHITLGPLFLFIPILMFHLAIKLLELLFKMLELPFKMINDHKGPPNAFTVNKT